MKTKEHLSDIDKNHTEKKKQMGHSTNYLSSDLPSNSQCQTRIEKRLESILTTLGKDKYTISKLKNKLNLLMVTEVRTVIFL